MSVIPDLLIVPKVEQVLGCQSFHDIQCKSGIAVRILNGYDIT